MTKRNVELALARVAGYHQDHSRYTRLLCERRCTSLPALLAAWRAGWKQKQAGTPCTCRDCT